MLATKAEKKGVTNLESEYYFPCTPNTLESLITSYLELGDFHSAAMVFFIGLERNHLHWNSFLEELRNHGGDPFQILEVFVELQNMGAVFGSENLAMLLKMCAQLKDPWLGLEIHVCLIKGGFDQNGHALMKFYRSCWGSDSANKAFDETSDQTSLLWNEAILVALRNEEWFQGVDVLQRMQFSYMKVDNNAFTIARVLQACRKMGALDEGKQIHVYILRNGMELKLLVCNSLIYMYSKSKTNTPIRVIKNTTICADCHTFAEYASLARKREIILKDGIRFHHFREGKCSCRESL